jgi:predicted permease
VAALLQDLRYGLRLLAKSPGFTAAVVLTLALGIGANTVLFSIVNGVLLEPLRFPHADQLVTLYENHAHFEYGSISYPNFLDWQRDNRTFAAMAGFRPDDFTLTGFGPTERVDGVMVSSGFFNLLGVRLVLGRDLDPAVDHLGGTPEALISESFWQEKYGGAHDVVGKPLELNGTDYTIVGVIPASFHLYMQNFRTSDVYIPLGQWNDVIFHERDVGMGLDAIARLKPGVSVDQARADMDGVTTGLANAYPDVDNDITATVVPLKEKIVGEIRPFLLVILAAVFFVLLIACVNVANLLLSRSMQRSREFAIRAALGAGRSRVVRQLLTESVLLSLLGGSFGLLFASWGTQAAMRFLPFGLPRSEEIHLNAPVLLFTFAISVLAGLLFGLAPALKSRCPDLQETLKAGARGSTGSRSRVQNILVAAETAFALVLLIGAGLMLRSLADLWGVDPGFRPDHVLFFQISLPPSMRDAPPDAIRSELRRLHNVIAAVPGVSSLSLSRGGLPMWGDSDDPFWITGRPKPARESDMPWTLWYEVEPDYLQTMGISLKRGRFFTTQDNENSPLVGVVDEEFAQKYFPNEDPIGHSINDIFVEKPFEIVGVVGHVKHWGLDDKLALHAEFYIPFAQIPPRFMSRASLSTNVLVRGKTAPLALVDPIRRAVEGVNSEEVVFEVHSYDEIVARSVSARSFSMVLLTVFAGFALILACMGIYGVISYLVGQRTHEIGIRMALGAQRSNVLTLVLSEGARTTLFGVAIGLLGALALTRLMGSVLYGVSATDPLTFVGVAVLLSVISLLACYIPARLATRIDPMVALRYE